jgi:hypothetical protein
VIFVVFLQLGFFVEKQLLDLPTLRKIASDFEQCPVVLNVLLYDKTLHYSHPKITLGQGLELDQCVIVQIR